VSVRELVAKHYHDSEQLNAVSVCHVNKYILDGLSNTMAADFVTRSLVRQNISAVSWVKLTNLSIRNKLSHITRSDFRSWVGCWL